MGVRGREGDEGREGGRRQGKVLEKKYRWEEEENIAPDGRIA